MYFDRSNLTDAQLLDFYKALLYPRLVEEKMLLLLRQGRISKWFSGIGQEAIAVGATLAMQAEEWILPLHRNLGVFTTRHMPLHKLFQQWQGHPEGYSQGRERSFHFGSHAHHIWGMISHLGPQLSIADGIGLAHHLQNEQKAVLAFTGEGGTSEGEFHEALNLAAVWDLPVIFLIENNGYALSTPVEEQYRCSQLADKAWGYGMEGMRINGNNLLEVYQTIQKAREYAIREQKPVLIEAMTFRMRGHEEASGTKYVPAAKLEEWALLDPIHQYEAFLADYKLLSDDSKAAIHQELHDLIEAALALTATAAPVHTSIEQELNDIYAPLPDTISTQPTAETALAAMPAPREKRFIDAITEGLQQAMNKHPQLILMGQDIGAYGGAFKITDGFTEQFGKARVRNTPLCESAVLGAAAGLGVRGFKSMVEMQFADFVTCGFNQIVNNLAKLHYRWGQAADVVLRLPTGAGVGAGPFHSQSNEAWFTHTPGLKVVYPSNPVDAKGLLLAAFEDPNPVLYFEHKALYRSVTGPVPEVYYITPIGKAHLVLEGTAASIITYGSGVHWALDYATQHPEASLDILDLRTLLPLDYNAIRDTVQRTGRVLVLHEDTLTGGLGGEIAAWIAEHCFSALDAPVMRCASLDTPVPFAGPLEQQFLAKSRLEASLHKLLAY